MEPKPVKQWQIETIRRLAQHRRLRVDGNQLVRISYNEAEAVIHKLRQAPENTIFTGLLVNSPEVMTGYNGAGDFQKVIATGAFQASRRDEHEQ